jgi:hypothetical protein
MLIVNIVSLGHSGSTLIGNVLGSHSKGLHIGELVAPLQKGKPIVCRACIAEPCPIWGTILTEKFLRSAYQHFLSKKKIVGLFKTHNGEVFNRLFEQVPRLNFIVDSSKNVDWYQYNSANRKHKTKYVFLKREISALVASYKRAYNTTVDVSLPKAIKGLRSVNKLYESLNESEKFSLEYEQLVTNPESNIERLARFLGIEYEASMLNFNQHRQHLIGGNQGLLIQQDHSKIEQVDKLINYKTPESTIDYYKSLNGFTLDERWKFELTHEEKLFILDQTKDAFVF